MCTDGLRVQAKADLRCLRRLQFCLLQLAQRCQPWSSWSSHRETPPRGREGQTQAPGVAAPRVTRCRGSGLSASQERPQGGQHARQRLGCAPGSLARSGRRTGRRRRRREVTQRLCTGRADKASVPKHTAHAAALDRTVQQGVQLSVIHRRLPLRRAAILTRGRRPHFARAGLPRRVPAGQAPLHIACKQRRNVAAAQRRQPAAGSQLRLQRGCSLPGRGDHAAAGHRQSEASNAGRLAEARGGAQVPVRILARRVALFKSLGGTCALRRATASSAGAHCALLSPLQRPVWHLGHRGQGGRRHSSLERAGARCVPRNGVPKETDASPLRDAPLDAGHTHPLAPWRLAATLVSLTHGSSRSCLQACTGSACLVASASVCTTP